MNLIEKLKERYRSELPINPEIIEREKKFNSEDQDRQKWLLNSTYLSSGNLTDLKNNSDPSVPLEDRMAYFPKGKQPKKVVVKVPIKNRLERSILDAERQLKLQIVYRDCNAGINYKNYKKGEYQIAEATPAILTQDG